MEQTTYDRLGDALEAAARQDLARGGVRGGASLRQPSRLRCSFRQQPWRARS